MKMEGLSTYQTHQESPHVTELLFSYAWIPCLEIMLRARQWGDVGMTRHALLSLIPEPVKESLFGSNQGKWESLASTWSIRCSHTWYVYCYPVLNSLHLEPNLKACWVRILIWLDVFSVAQSPWRCLNHCFLVLHKTWKLERLSNTSRISTHDRFSLIMYLILHTYLEFILRARQGELLAWPGVFWSYLYHTKYLSHYV